MARISSAETRRASDALFSATPPDLAQTYSPEIPSSIFSLDKLAVFLINFLSINPYIKKYKIERYLLSAFN